MRTFTITDEQVDKIKVWKAAHMSPDGEKCILRPGSIGDLEHYRICPTGVGDFISVHCPCGNELDLNDYGSF